MQPYSTGRVNGCRGAGKAGARGCSGQNRSAQAHDHSKDRRRKKNYQWSDGVALEFIENFTVGLSPGPHDHTSGLGVCTSIILWKNRAKFSGVENNDFSVLKAGRIV
jgi:hypothetical protein